MTNNIFANKLNIDLEKISHLSCPWKLSFCPELSKQAQEVVLSYKVLKHVHPPLAINGNNVS